MSPSACLRDRHHQRPETALICDKRRSTLSRAEKHGLTINERFEKQRRVSTCLQEPRCSDAVDRCNESRGWRINKVRSTRGEIENENEAHWGREFNEGLAINTLQGEKRWLECTLRPRFGGEKERDKRRGEKQSQGLESASHQVTLWPRLLSFASVPWQICTDEFGLTTFVLSQTLTLALFSFLSFLSLGAIGNSFYWRHSHAKWTSHSRM